MKEILKRIEYSFKKASKGNEEINILIWCWGLSAYVLSYFVFDQFIKNINSVFVDNTVGVVVSIFFMWHIFVLKKCTPKKQKLSKEEKKKLREKGRKEFGKKFLRKLLLQESITKFDPIFVTMVIDAYCIAHFMGYLFR